MITTEQSVTIALPREEVVRLLQDQNHFKDWQDGLISFKNTTATIGEIGSRRSMKIRMAGTTITMTEEILDMEFPTYWKAEYRSKGVRNVQTNNFEVLNVDGQQHTVWHSISKFYFTGMMRLIASSQPQLFKKQTVRFLENFKRFSENKVNR